MAETFDLAAIGPGPVYRKTNIWLPQLIAEGIRRGERFVEGRTFEDCHLEGPAVMCPLDGVHFERCDFGPSDGDIRNLMLAPLGPKKITGVVTFRNCTFRGCTFFAVGFTGSPQFLQSMHDGVRGPAT
ncbi:hypothetical protein ACO2Q1_08765 [Brevundimonas sp. VNH65]|uniref:hypothetical protein n=1 Tax=Brevundimonas sp. VNH65 TaxID=3400917 RepID=UPI003C0D88B0